MGTLDMKELNETRTGTHDMLFNSIYERGSDKYSR